WSHSKHTEWIGDMCSLMVACNIPWWAVEHPFWRHFFQKWVGGCMIPGRRHISGRALDDEAERVVEGIRSRVKGRYGTGQCDGWKNIAKTSLIASMVNVEYTPFLLGVADISSQPKTAEVLLSIVLKEVAYCMDTLGILLIAWCTDASGESLKMRRLLREEFPWMITVDCWAHQ
ncbi:hypothetical protein BD779DRAFT_1430590, partial [Infundibulicybe gibba]